MIYSAQIRAARGLLDWNRDQLAQAAGIGLSTVQRMEKGEGLALGQAGNIWRLQAALEAAGIVFLPADASGGPGVRLKSSPE
ncbi:MAG: helix-turn-helix domain-containing protein [Alphaproteobacteria bacterium]|nr:helix-turn-helix domain-containing protein [Alphaproteobacteria bacterium]